MSEFGVGKIERRVKKARKPQPKKQFKKDEKDGKAPVIAETKEVTYSNKMELWKKMVKGEAPATPAPQIPIQRVTPQVPILRQFTPATAATPASAPIQRQPIPIPRPLIRQSTQPQLQAPPKPLPHFATSRATEEESDSEDSEDDAITVNVLVNAVALVRLTDADGEVLEKGEPLKLLYPMRHDSSKNVVMDRVTMTGNGELRLSQVIVFTESTQVLSIGQFSLP